MAKIKCDMCERVICTERPDRPQNELQGATFVLEDGSTITACTDCICKVGENPEYLDDFLKARWKK